MTLPIEVESRVSEKLALHPLARRASQCCVLVGTRHENAVLRFRGPAQVVSAGARLLDRRVDGHLERVRSMLSSRVVRAKFAAALVPGDVILLKVGDNVPADCRLIEATGVRVNAAMLTGEARQVSRVHVRGRQRGL